MFDLILLPAFNPGPMTGDGNNTYLIVEPDGGAALIDAGIGDPRHLAAIEDALRARRAQLNDVYVTHAHGDHASGAVALAQAYPRARFSKYLSPAHDARYAVSWLPLGDGDEVPAGDTRLKVLYTPGHAPDHVAFWHEDTRTAFTGDLVVQGTTVTIAASKGGDLSQYLASLARVMAMKATRLLPGHGPRSWIRKRFSIGTSNIASAGNSKCSRRSAPASAPCRPSRKASIMGCRPRSCRRRPKTSVPISTSFTGRAAPEASTTGGP